MGYVVLINQINSSDVLGLSEPKNLTQNFLKANLKKFVNLLIHYIRT